MSSSKPVYHLVTFSLPHLPSAGMLHMFWCAEKGWRQPLSSKAHAWCGRGSAFPSPERHKNSCRSQGCMQTNDAAEFPTASILHKSFQQFYPKSVLNFKRYSSHSTKINSSHTISIVKVSVFILEILEQHFQSTKLLLTNMISQDSEKCISIFHSRKTGSCWKWWVIWILRLFNLFLNYGKRSIPRGS